MTQVTQVLLTQVLGTTDSGTVTQVLLTQVTQVLLTRVL